MICAKGGGLASSNEMFTVGCSIVEVAFEFLISTDANERAKWREHYLPVFHGKCWLLE